MDGQRPLGAGWGVEAVNLFIPGEFTTLNEYIDAERTNKYIAAQIKQAETQRVQVEAVNCPPVVIYPAALRFVWYRRNRRSDPDNVAFATKFILDGLMGAGVLAGDGWKYISSIKHDFELDAKNPGVEVVTV